MTNFAQNRDQNDTQHALNGGGGTQHTLADTLWTRLTDLITEIASLDRHHAPELWDERTMRFRTVALLFSSIPDRAGRQTGRKTILASVMRDTAGLEPSLTLPMIEAAIREDIEGGGQS